jgi:hypothetical protein
MGQRDIYPCRFDFGGALLLHPKGFEQSIECQYLRGGGNQRG